MGLSSPSERTAASADADGKDYKRRLVADLCRLLGQSVVARDASDATAPRIDGKTSGGKNGAETAAGLGAKPLPELSPRMRQTLDRLLLGDSEKQIALRLGISRHTIHVYVKAIYRGFEVSSRGELLAKFVSRPVFTKSN